MQSVLTCLVHAQAWLRPGRSCATYGRTGSQIHMGERTQARYLASHIWLSTHTKLTIQNAKCPYMPCECPSMVETWQIVCKVRENRGTITHGCAYSRPILGQPNLGLKSKSEAAD